MWAVKLVSPAWARGPTRPAPTHSRPAEKLTGRHGLGLDLCRPDHSNHPYPAAASTSTTTTSHSNTGHPTEAAVSAWCV